MDIHAAIKQRRSVRAYVERSVEEDKLSKILEAARLAPSARNIQEWRFVVVRAPQTLAKLAVAASNQSFVGQAPIVIVGCASVTDYTMRGGQLAYPIDLAIALDHMTLQAVEEGLGTCWIGSFNEDQVRDILSIPGSIRIVCLLTLGYPADSPKPKDRLPMNKIAAFERWDF